MMHDLLKTGTYEFYSPNQSIFTSVELSVRLLRTLPVNLRLSRESQSAPVISHFFSIQQNSGDCAVLGTRVHIEEYYTERSIFKF